MPLTSAEPFFIFGDKDESDEVVILVDKLGHLSILTFQKSRILAVSASLWWLCHSGAPVTDCHLCHRTMVPTTCSRGPGGASPPPVSFLTGEDQIWTVEGVKSVKGFDVNP